jgi:PAS domain S-box-containing protein
MGDGEEGRQFSTGDLNRVPADVLREIVANSPLGIILTGPDGQYRYVSRSAIGTLGDRPTRVVGRTKRDFLDADAVAALDEMEARVRAGSLHERQVLEIVTLWGRRHYAFHKFMVGPTDPADGEDAGTICTFVYDLTSVRDLETQLNQTQGILERLLTHSPVGMVAVEHARPERPLYVSPNTERLLGYVQGEQPFTVEWILAQVHPDDVDETEAFLTQLRNDREEPHRCRFRFRHADGEYRWIRASSQPLTEDGRATGVVAFLMDTTAWDQAEESQRRLEARLRRVEHFESLGQLAGGLAHDFNNLLAVIGNYVQVVDATVRRHAREGAPLDGDAVETLLGDLAQISQARDTAAALTRQLLLFGRRESAPPSVVEVNDVIREAQDMLTRAVGDRIAVEFRLASTPLPVLCDSGRLGSVVVNLVVNAAQAMPDGGSLVIATRRVQLDDTEGGHEMLGQGEHVELSVADTGEGMAPEVRARAFEPFFTTKGGQGTGLGLASVLAVVSECGGDVELDSELDAGTTVRILLPVALDDRR